MTYFFSRQLDMNHADTVTAVREALAAEGFGVITEIDLKQTFKSKLGIDFRPYVILGACNPKLAYEALLLEDHAGVMLPCNVVVQQLTDRLTEVAAIDPAASMQAIDNPALHRQAQVVGEKLRMVLARL